MEVASPILKVVGSMLRGSVRFAAFEPARIADPATRALMQRIEVSLDPELDAAFPHRRAARGPWSHGSADRLPSRRRP